MGKSDLHKKILSLIKECFPKETIREEEPIKIGKKTLYLDIYIPRLNIAIEADGEQHFKFSKFYHADIFAFNKQKNNDKEKEEYCTESGITLVRIKYNDSMTVNDISKKITDKLREQSK